MTAAGLVAIVSLAAAAPARAAAPVSTAAPTITPAASVGQGTTLTEGHGGWTPDPTSYGYQWYDCTSASACTPIANAMGQSYLVTAADVGYEIEVDETAYDGSTPSTPVASPPTVIVIAPPTISGAPVQGDTLTATEGSLPDTTEWVPAYAWEDCSGVPLTCSTSPSSTDAPTYTLTAADVGQQIEVVVSATLSASTVGPISSGAFGPISGTPVSSTPPSVLGAPWVGQTLTVAHGDWTYDPSAYDDEWLTCPPAPAGCVDTGVRGDTYVVSAADVGDTIEVGETAVNGAGPASVPVASPATATVTLVPTTTALVAASGAPFAGQQVRLLASVTAAIQTAEPTGTLTMFDGAAAIPGCSSLPVSGAAPNPSVTVACDTKLPVGADAVSAVFTPADGSPLAGSSSAATAEAVALVPTTTAITAVPVAPFADQEVTLLATVTSTVDTSPPAGSLTMSSGGAAIPGCSGLRVRGAAANPSVTVTCHTMLPAASDSVSATFTPAAGSPLAGSSSSIAAGQVTVSKAPTTTTMTTVPLVDLGHSATFTVAVSPDAVAGAAVKPSGSISFTENERPVRACRNRPLIRDRATCRVSFHALGTDRLRATYGGDSRFTSSDSATQKVSVEPVPTVGFVNSYLSWSFYFTPSATAVTGLAVTGLASDSSITLACRGAGCRFSRRIVAHTGAGSLDLARVIGANDLSVGTRLTVSITHPGWLGKFYGFTMRSARQPQVLESCLAVNGTVPGAGCRTG